jgi:hypothetical protein
MNKQRFHLSLRPQPTRLARALPLALAAMAASSLAAAAPQAPGSVVFMTPDGLPVGEAVGSLPPAPERGIAANRLGLPAGAKLLMSLQHGQLPADGRSSTRLRIEAFDAKGQRWTQPVRLRLETSIGRFQLPNAGAGTAVTELATVDADVRGGMVELVLLAPATPGTASLRASSGAVGVEGELQILPDLRPLFAVGIVEGALHLGKVSRSAQAPAIVNASFEDLLRSWNNREGDLNDQANATGRAALYVKGAIRGDMLLTLAADTEPVRRKLFRDIDPNAYYPVVGDASRKDYDAQSSGRLYVRIDKGRSYALIGDFQTTSSNPDVQLGQVRRALTGAQWVYQGQSVRVSAFAANPTTRAFVDEQPGRGISGPYAVGQPNALANSERVEIIVRSRLQPDVIVRTIPMQRYVDYDFEPFTGRILFKAPVPSIDEAGNPITIRIAYEAEGAAERHWVAGGEVQLQLGDRLRVGATAMRDDTPGAPYQMASGNARWQLGDHTWVAVEAAQSEGTSLVNQSFAGAQPMSETKGRAARVALEHRSTDTQVQAQIAKTGPGFQNPGSAISPGRVEAQLQAEHRLNDKVSLRAGGVRTEDNSNGPADGAGRMAASVGAGVKISERLRVDVAVNRVAQDAVAGSSGVTTTPAPTALGGIGFGLAAGGSLTNPIGASAVGQVLVPAGTAQAGAEYTSVGARVTAQVTEKTAAYVEGERTTDGRNRAAVGGEVRLDERSRAYARHEFSNSITGPFGLNTDGIERNTTAVGVDTRVPGDAQLYAEYRMAGSVEGSDAARAVGLRKTFEVSPGLNLQAAFERQNISQANGQEDSATAISLGANLFSAPDWRAMGRLDWRNATYQQEVLSVLGLERQFSNRWTGIVRNYYRQSESTLVQTSGSTALGTSLQNRFQLGAAYRSVDGGFWDGLGRVEYRIDRNTGSTGGLLDQDVHAVIGSVHGNMRLHRSLTLAGQLAAKQVDERVALGGVDPAGQWRGALASGRVIWDLADRFDLSLFGSWQRNSGTTLTGLGLELGYRVVDNVWVAAAYNHGQYSDVELFSANATWNGLTMRLRWKFDEKTLAMNDPRINRVMDEAAAGVARIMRLWRE